MEVNEIFYSLQGEGTLVGTPSYFIRLQGCNLFPESTCRYCDTLYAQDPIGNEMSVREVVDKLYDIKPMASLGSWVCITGGEPLQQESELHSLVRLLKACGYLVSIETNGTLTRPWWYTKVDSWVADCKTPSSGVGLFMEDWLYTRSKDQVKFVVRNREDLDFTREVLRRAVQSSPVKLISPVMGLREGETSYSLDQLDLETLANFCTENNCRLSLQLHKLIWGNRRGV